MNKSPDLTNGEERAGVSLSSEARLGYIDTLRGLASVQVLLSHSMLAFFLSVAFASPHAGSFASYAATPLVFAFDGASAVCIFFVLSGYVLTPLFTHSRARAGALVGSRFLRLGIPAIAACAFSALLFKVFGGDNVAAAGLAKSQWLSDNWRPTQDLWFLKDAVVNGVLLGFQDTSIPRWFGVPATALAPVGASYVAPLWTLSVEFYGSILVLLMARTKSWPLVILATLLLSRTYLLCFLVGHVAARFDLGDKRQLAPWPVAAGVALIGFAVCVVSHFWTPDFAKAACEGATQLLPSCPLGKPDYLARIYGACFLTLGLLQCAPVRRLLSHPWLRSLGRLSFPIYLTHWPLIFGFGSFTLLMTSPWIGPHPARLLALVVSIAATLAVSLGFVSVDQLALRASRAWRRSGGAR